MKRFSTQLLHPPARAALARSFLAVAALVATPACGDDPPPTPAILVAKDPTDIPAPIGERDATTVEVELSVQEVVGELAPGVKTYVWTFNGTVPGPLIRVREGDSVTLRLTNALGNVEPHDLDLHVLEQPGGGAEALNVKPGETRELQFEATRQGAFLYHCSAEGMPWEHVAHGMYGAILVEPAGGLSPVDLEAYVAQSEWYLGKPNAGSEEAEESEDAPPSDVLMLDEAAARRADPTLFTFNGHQASLMSESLYGDRLHLPAGGRARFIFANAGPNLPSSFHVMGGIFDRIFTGPFTSAPTEEETVLVPPGSAAVLELATPVEGNYHFVDHALFHAELGAMGHLHVGPTSP